MKKDKRLKELKAQRQMLEYVDRWLPHQREEWKKLCTEIARLEKSIDEK